MKPEKIGSIEPPHFNWGCSEGSPRGPASCHPLPPPQSPPALSAQVSEQPLPLGASRTQCIFPWRLAPSQARCFALSLWECTEGLRAVQNLSAPGRVWMLDPLRKRWHVPPSASVLAAICHLPPHWGFSVFAGKGRLGSTGWNSCAVLGLSWTHCTLSHSPRQCVETGGGKSSKQPFVESHSSVFHGQYRYVRSVLPIQPHQNPP